MVARRHRRWVLRGVTSLAAGAVVAAAAFVLWPLPQGLLDYGPVASVHVLDRTGQPLRELRSAQEGRSTPLAQDEIPAALKDAIVSAEDHRFYSHPGVDPVAIARAAWSNARHRRIVSGGSTLSQQLARVLVPRRRTLFGKLQEALWALRLEAHLSKEAVLAQYLNRVPFGNGTFGVQAAAQLYFGRDARHLSVGQAAALAAMPRGPTAYDPYRHPERLKRRQRWVLQRMIEVGRLAPDEGTIAAQAPLDLRPPSLAFRAPHLVQWVTAHLAEWGLEGATRIRTTLDPELQAAAEKIVAEEVARLGDRNVGQAAALVLDNATGEVLAYVGSADFFDDGREGQNDGVQMRRQPGSALKPFAYLEAFETGASPSTLLADTEAHFPGAGGTYSPENYDRRSHGPVRAREALANSYNVPAVRLAQQLGTDRLLNALHAAGFASLHESSEHYGLGLVLGNGEVSLWEAARAYAGLSRGGVLEGLHVVLDARDVQGAPLPLRSELQPRRFASPASAALVTDILSDNAARARAFGLDSVLRLPFPSAAKTGTSKGYSDNWTFGYTRERTVAVWAGNFDRSPMRNVSGITGAGPIFRALMLEAMKGIAGAPLVDASLLDRARICPLSGQLATAACPSRMEEVFAAGRAPKQPCSMHAHLAPAIDRDLSERCDARDGRVTDLGPGYYDWARAEGLAREPWLAARCREDAAKVPPEPPRIVFPTRGAEFQLIPDLPREDQSIPLRVLAAGTEDALEVRLDGAHLLSLPPPFVGRIPATPGAHALSLHREGEATALSTVTFTVRGGGQRL